MNKAVVALVLLNLIATAAVTWDALRPKHFQYRTDFYQDSMFNGLLQRDGQNGWEVVSMRRVTDGEGRDRQWGMEVVLKRRE